MSATWGCLRLLRLWIEIFCGHVFEEELSLFRFGRYRNSLIQFAPWSTQLSLEALWRRNFCNLAFSTWFWTDWGHSQVHCFDHFSHQNPRTHHEARCTLYWCFLRLARQDIICLPCQIHSQVCDPPRLHHLRQLCLPETKTIALSLTLKQID